MSVHVTMLYAGILGLFLTVLFFNVMHHWVRVTSSGQEFDLAMRRAERVLGNFVECAPIMLILMMILESKGTPAGVMHAFGIVFVLSRLFHASGSNFVRGAGVLRFLGAQLTFLAIMVASMACIYLFVFGKL